MVEFTDWLENALHDLTRVAWPFVVAVCTLLCWYIAVHQLAGSRKQHPNERARRWFFSVILILLPPALFCGFAAVTGLWDNISNALLPMRAVGLLALAYLCFMRATRKETSEETVATSVTPWQASVMRFYLLVVLYALVAAEVLLRWLGTGVFWIAIQNTLVPLLVYTATAVFAMILIMLWHRNIRIRLLQEHYKELYPE